jgi:hypothetical protein
MHRRVPTERPRAAVHRVQCPISWRGHACGSFRIRIVCVPTTQLWCRFFAMTQRAGMRLRHTCGCYGMFVTLQMLACPRRGCGRLAGSDRKARSALHSRKASRRVSPRGELAGHTAAPSGFLSLSATPTGQSGSYVQATARSLAVVTIGLISRAHILRGSKSRNVNLYIRLHQPHGLTG